MKSKGFVQATLRLEGEGRAALVAHLYHRPENDGTDCAPRDLWCVFAYDTPWPVCVATVNTDPRYVRAIGSDAKAWLDYIHVPEDWRRQGIATRLVLALRKRYGSIDGSPTDAPESEGFCASVFDAVLAPEVLIVNAKGTP